MDHGHADGRWLGMTICYRIQADGLTCLHLSDAGVVPDAAQVKEFGPVDILFVPVGGHFTLDGEGARQAIDMINPAVAIPMHYRGPYTLRDQFPIEGVEPFLQGLKNVSIRREQQVEITLETLPPKKSVWVLTPAL
jgi:L-ascorbate metabolism protein UlaG (beta-lactamase superfamily)